MKPAPDWLSWDLWQGPAPRRDYQDNLVHYNWHWFWHWGTGETCNNAMHELDVARWAIGADYPDYVKVDASRRFYTDDDWEMYDTMHAEFGFGDVSVVWEAHSCNKVNRFGEGRGTLIYGTNGAARVGRNGYLIQDLNGEVIDKVEAAGESQTVDVRGGGRLNDLHVANFLGVLRGESEPLHSPVLDGHKSTLLCHLANIAYRTGETLDINPENGRIPGRVRHGIMGSRVRAGLGTESLTLRTGSCAHCSRFSLRWRCFWHRSRVLRPSGPTFSGCRSRMPASTWVLTAMRPP